MDIKWSTRAANSYRKIRADIRERFTPKEEKEFVKEVFATLSAIILFPKGYPESKKPKGTRKAVIHPHSTVFYRIKSKKRIELITFWDNRDNPKKLK